MIKLIIIIFLFLLNFNVLSQGRNIDGQIITLKPTSGESIISRKNGIYTGIFILRNNGPDTIKPGDSYEIKVTFSNVIYNPYRGSFLQTLNPLEEDTLSINFKMTWDTDAQNINFCTFFILTGLLSDSIKKEVGISLINNKDCISVNHISKLDFSLTNLTHLLIYPNPSTGIVYINHLKNLGSIIDICIYNQFGQEVAKINSPSNIQNNNIDLSYLEKGLYFIKVINSKVSFIRKLIIY